MSNKTLDELRARIAFLEDVIENIPTGIIVTDRSGKILIMNRWQERISRIRREQVLGAFFHEKWERLFEQGIMGDYWELLEHGKPFQATLHEVYPQFYDERVSAFSRGAALTSGNGMILLHDVSTEMQRDRRDILQLSEQLAESSNFLKNLIDSSPNVVITTDQEGIIKSANRTAEQVFHYSKDHFVGQHISFMLREPAELDRCRSIALDGRAVEVTCVRKDGVAFPTRMHVTDIRGSTNEVQAKLFLFTDLTWEKRMEEKLALSEKLAIYSELMAGIAHQLNNPLVGVANFSSLLLERMDRLDPNRPLVETIYEAARKCQIMLSTMIKSLREPKSTFHTLDIGEVLDTAVQTSLTEEPTLASLVRVHTIIHSDLPPIRGDSLQLLEAFRNILVNALQAMPNGGELTVKTMTEALEKKVQVCISDTGSGILAEHRDKVFEPFFTTKKNTRGGLGLSFAYRVVKSHSGRIDVRSSQETGTTFTISLPIYEGTAAR
jgi:PAS domain S-box-containing protein